MNKHELINYLQKSQDFEIIEKLKNSILNNKNATPNDNELLHRIYYIQSRQSGNSTRNIDTIIQQTFNNPDKWIYVQDVNYNASRFWFEKLVRRISIEHNINDFEFNAGQLKIKYIGINKRYKTQLSNIAIEIDKLYKDDDEITII